MTSLSSRSFQVGPVPVHVFEDKRDMGAAAAKQAGGIVRQAIAERGRARVIVGTGNSQDEVIAAFICEEGVDWKAVEAFHMDEYIGLSEDHSASFRRWLRVRLIDEVHIGQAHYVFGDADDPDAECQRYGDLLAEAPIDLCFIGFGENGHIAFNDPHVADFNDPLMVKCVEMDEPCRMQQVGEGHFESLETAPKKALTLTCSALMSARNIVGCVPDERKAEAVKNAIEGPLSTDCPASVVFTHPGATIYLDTHSASLLDSH